MFSALTHFIFGSSGLFGSHSQTNDGRASAWKDKRLCFDLRSSDLELDRGEQLIGCFYPIEDIKGNQDEFGLMKVTNLRLIWICCKKRKVNLSIGWRTVTLTYEQSLKDALGGSSSSLFVLSKYDSTKYEFVFSKKTGQNDIWLGLGSGGSPETWASISQLKKFNEEKPSLISHLSPMYLDDPFDVVFRVWQAYKQTQLFRHCRSNLTQLISNPSQAGESQTAASNNFRLTDVNKLPSEEIIEAFSDIVQFDYKATKYVGTLLLTNVRIIWIDDSLPLRNLSIPYIRIESIKTKQGNKITINAHDYLASSTHVDFQVQKSLTGTSKAAKLISEQIQNLYALYKAKPRFGPESCEESINFMSHLRPIQYYFDSIDRSFAETLENFGPPANRDARESLPSAMGNEHAKPVEQDDLSDTEIDRIESDLAVHKKKLKSYQNERPIDLDNEVIYSKDLGLAFEKPANGASLRSIWKIEI